MNARGGGGTAIEYPHVAAVILAGLVFPLSVEAAMGETRSSTSMRRSEPNPWRTLKVDVARTAIRVVFDGTLSLDRRK
jgi:hypothetical protein